jgi:hypothetical protein
MKDKWLRYIEKRYFYITEDFDDTIDKMVDNIQSQIKSLIEKKLNINDVFVEATILEEPEYRIVVRIYLTKEYVLEITLNKDLEILDGIKSNNELYEYDEKVKDTVKILYAFMASNIFLNKFKSILQSIINSEMTKSKTENEITNNSKEQI